jgi:hypothetical protein
MAVWTDSYDILSDTSLKAEQSIDINLDPIRFLLDNIFTSTPS